MHIYFFGTIKLNERFNSYLILVIQGDVNKYKNIRDLYLMNISENKLKSITKISSYSCFEGTCIHMFSKKINKSSFLLQVQ